MSLDPKKLDAIKELQGSGWSEAMSAAEVLENEEEIREYLNGKGEKFLKEISRIIVISPSDYANMWKNALIEKFGKKIIEKEKN